MGNTIANQRGGQWQDSLEYRERSMLDMNPTQIIDIRLSQRLLGLDKDLVKLTELHNQHRKRSTEYRTEDQCILWYKVDDQLITFDEIAFRYKSTYFMTMAKELNNMTVGVPIMGRRVAGKEWRIEHASIERKKHLDYCKLLNICELLSPDLDISDFAEYLSQLSNGIDPDKLTIRFGFRKRTVDALPFRQFYQVASDYLRNMSAKEVRELDEKCLSELYNVERRQLHNDILIFLKGILTAPKTTRSLTVWRYLNVTTAAIEHRYTQVGDIVPVDRFLSTGSSPIDPNRTHGILLRIDLPPEFPFWMLSSEVSYTASIEHREIVLPYTTDPSGKTLDYGLKIKKVIKDPVLRTENVTLSPKYLIVVSPAKLSKPIKLVGFYPYCA